MAHNDLVRSILRSLDIVDLVAQAERGMTLGEICKVLGYKETTAYNIIRTLVSRNVLERTPPPIRYRLGHSIFRLADEVNNHRLIQRAGELLQELYDDILGLLPHPPTPSDDLAVSFAQSIGGEIRLVLRIRSDRPNVLTRPMSLMSPYRSTSSLIYQAYWTREERDAYRRAYPFEKHGAHLWPSLADLDRYLVEIRREHRASPAIYHPEELRVSVPVFGEDKMLTGVLGVGVWLRLNPLVRLRITRRLTEAAEQLSRPLAPPPVPPAPVPPPPVSSAPRATRRSLAGH